MKKLLILLNVAVGIAVCSCSDEIECDRNYLRSAESSDDISIKENSSVNINAIIALNQDSTSYSRSSDIVQKRIECIKDKANDTCFYVYKKTEGGWIMYSTDTRVPPIVAQSDSGTFEDLMRIDAARLWLKSMVEDMALIKKLPDSNLNFSKREIDDNKNFWKSISEPDKFVKQHKSIVDIDTTRLVPRGHYELYATKTYTEVLNSVYNLTLTKWDQEAPFNNCCPYRTDKPDRRAPAGCVPVAAAQVLFYLHYHFGVPEMAPSKGECTGNVDYYTSTQSDYNSEIWDVMKTDDSAAAPLLANCGKLVGVKYGNTGSGAYTIDLVDKVFKPYGINCESDVYDSSVLVSNLLTKVPVILRAVDNSTLMGHAFIADRYKKCRTVTVNHYVWVYDSPSVSGTPLPPVLDKHEYVYISPTTEYIGMNWGWGKSAYDTSEWFSLTGDWISSYPNMSGYNWNKFRYMIHGFEVIENR